MVGSKRVAAKLERGAWSAVGMVLGMVVLGVACEAERPKRAAPLIGLWEDARPDAKGGQLPGGEIWEFRPDGTYARLTGIMMNIVDADASAKVATKATIEGCTLIAHRTEASGARAMRLIQLHAAGGTFVVDGSEVVLDRESAKARRFAFSQARDALVLSTTGGSVRHDLLRVDWYKLPSAVELKQCSLERRDRQAAP